MTSALLSLAFALQDIMTTPFVLRIRVQFDRDVAPKAVVAPCTVNVLLLLVPFPEVVLVLLSEVALVPLPEVAFVPF